MKSPALPLIAPFLLFMAILEIESWLPNQHYIIYVFKTLAVGGIILWFWRSLPSMVPTDPLASILVGIVAVVLWIGLDPCLVHYQQPLIGRDPFQMYPPAEAWMLYFFRMIGFVLCVPIMEELFWRAFLMRWLIRDDFTSVPMGTYHHLSFCLTTAFFASVHGAEWPLAVIVGILYGAWFVRTKSLGNIILTHGVTNLLLGLWCLWRNDWHFLAIVPVR
ncbi:MAG: CAAX prenyl protease-related protein [Methylacidiphilales bacterium]|nr:CAAX prenyl protease-related protein [Candidatus Methylacidiphilales bacterium]